MQPTQRFDVAQQLESTQTSCANGAAARTIPAPSSGGAGRQRASRFTICCACASYVDTPTRARSLKHRSLGTELDRGESTK